MVLSGAWSSLVRIEGFLLQDAQATRAMTSAESNSIASMQEKEEKEAYSTVPDITARSASIGLKGDIFLSNLNFACPAGKLTMLTGSVASVGHAV